MVNIRNLTENSTSFLIKITVKGMKNTFNGIYKNEHNRLAIMKTHPLIMSSKQEVRIKRCGGELVIGRVKWFNNEKGYGFIEYREDEDIFVHYSTINCEGYKTLKEGQYVEFTLLETSKGYQAVDVTPIKEPAIVK